MKNLPLEADPLPIHVDSGGAFRVGPTRVTLEVVLTAYLQGSTPEQIVQAFDTLSLADVFSVIGHYLRHRAAFDEHLAEVEHRYQEYRARDLANGQAGLKQRLLARVAPRTDETSTSDH